MWNKKRDKICFGAVPGSIVWDSTIIAMLNCFKGHFVLRVVVQELSCKLIDNENLFIGERGCTK